MFKKLLIANRGEIACRVAATARRMGIMTVAVYSDADAKAAHVAACDAAVRIGPAVAVDSYLRGEHIIEAALASGAQAIHPGYGFLSENAEFAQACADAGLVFVGPPPAAIRAMGLKAESKRLMAQAGVPLVPGYHGASQDEALLQREADAIGYPVLIKASAGGGGKGMRVVEKAGDFAEALASCRREARASFGDDAVLVERYLQKPRHIEVQVFADSHGGCVHLFERDCSVQRRHQKVLEEAPAPGMDAALRERMGAAAVAAARAVGYVGAGTVEFIADRAPDGALRFHFMEMNTRLQVEHPVTEAITGLDLVEWQLRVAAGEALPLLQHELRIDGHAIEARICAENPESGFLPSTGVLSVWRTPAVARFLRAPARLDTGVREGDAVTPFYDPMLAKLIVHAADREAAVAAMLEALAGLHIAGVHTNVDFLRRIVASRSFSQADLDTALIEREREAWDQPTPLAPEWAAAAWASVLCAEDADAPSDGDPWARRDGWRLLGPSPRAVEFVRDRTSTCARLLRVQDGGLRLQLGDQSWDFESRNQGTVHQLRLGGRRRSFSIHRVDDVLWVFGDDPPAALRATRHGESVAGHDDAGLEAPMPGRVLALLVNAGDTVRRGQALAVMEAMKMEHTIAAPRDGRVSELLCRVGDQVKEGSELLRLDAGA